MKNTKQPNSRRQNGLFRGALKLSDNFVKINPRGNRMIYMCRFLAIILLCPLLSAADGADKSWPTWMGDPQRSGIYKGEISPSLKLKWTFRSSAKPAPAWPEHKNIDIKVDKIKMVKSAYITYDRCFQPVSSHGLLYFGSSSENKVVCLDAKSGKKVWTFLAGGPIRFAPTITGEKLLFGSDDGKVYCLDAKSGEQIWVFGGASEEVHYTPGNNRMISTWPIRTDIAVSGDSVTFCAGLFPQVGLFNIQLSLRDGSEEKRNVVDKNSTTTYEGYICRVGKTFVVRNGRGPATSLGEEVEGKIKFGGAAFVQTPLSAYSNTLIQSKNLRFVGGNAGACAIGLKDNKILWSSKVEGSVYGLALADDCLYVSTSEGLIYCFASGEVKKPVLIDESNAAEPKQLKGSSLTGPILDKLERDNGYCLIEGNKLPLAIGLAKSSELQIVCLGRTADEVEEMRLALDKLNIYGQVTVVQHDYINELLPFNANTFNLVISDRAEIEQDLKRVLRPFGGLAVLSQGDDIKEHYIKGPSEDTSSWSHAWGNAGNTASNNCRTQGKELALQWFGRPGPADMVDRHLRPVPPLAAAGHMVIPGDDKLFVVDAFNGTVMWEKKLQEFNRLSVFRDCSNVALSEKYVYAATAAKCLVLNVVNGTEINTLSLPKESSEYRWGYLAVDKDAVFGSTVKKGASRRIKESFNVLGRKDGDNVPVSTSLNIFSMDPRSSAIKWLYQPNGVIINSSIAVSHGRVIFVESLNAKTLETADGRVALKEALGGQARVTALSAKDGKLLWTTDLDLSEVHHALTLMCTADKTIIIGSGTQEKSVWNTIVSLKSENGALNWRQKFNTGFNTGGDHGKLHRRAVLLQNKLLLSEPYLIELKDGSMVPNWVEPGRTRCGSFSASDGHMFFRTYNPMMMDLSNKEISPITTLTRPGCSVNIINSCGLLLMPEASSGCSCRFPMQASIGFSWQDKP